MNGKKNIEKCEQKNTNSIDCLMNSIEITIHDSWLLVFFSRIWNCVTNVPSFAHTKKCNEKPSLRFPLYIFHSNCKSNRLISEKNHNQHILCTPASILISSLCITSLFWRFTLKTMRFDWLEERQPIYRHKAYEMMTKIIWTQTLLLHKYYLGFIYSK